MIDARANVSRALPQPNAKGPTGRWSVVTVDGGAEAVKLQMCTGEWTLTFRDPITPWRDGFEARNDAQPGATPTLGSLRDVRQHTQHMLGDASLDARTREGGAVALAGGGGGTGAGAALPPLLSEVSGSGPWFWAGSGPLGFLRGGVLVTPWGEGVWGISRGSEQADDATVFVDFAGSQHNVRMHNPGCMRMQSKRRADGDIVGVDYSGIVMMDKCRLDPASAGWTGGG